MCGPRWSRSGPAGEMATNQNQPRAKTRFGVTTTNVPQDVQMATCMPVDTVQRVSHLCQEYCARATNLPCSRPPSGWCSLRCSSGPGTGPVRQTRSPPANRTDVVEAGRRLEVGSQTTCSGPRLHTGQEQETVWWLTAYRLQG